ncbi:MAG: DNA mismatch repair endonuclease MutL [Blautia sp.]
MRKIAVLDQNTIDKIAAGEVVERPASVVKELVENAIDAGSTAITVEIKEGGISFIRVTDNGGGMEKEQVPLAFLRHATSKIEKVEDLLQISSLGFRGEALSSISAVAQVEMITKTPEALTGIRYQIEGGMEKSLEEIGAPCGTTIIVRNLFFNTPARAKFLKTPATEAGYVNTYMEQLALSHDHISFKYMINGQTKLHSSGNSSLRDVIYNIYGRDITKELLPVKWEKDGISIDGFAGKPVVARGNRAFENYYVNGRYVKSKLVMKAIEDAYKPFMMQHKYPFVCFQFQIPGNEVDINVHPTKMEVRFQKQQEIYNAVYEALTDTLNHRELIPSMELKKEKEENRQEKKPVSKLTGPEPFEKNRKQFKKETPPVSVVKEDSPVWKPSVPSAPASSVKPVSRPLPATGVKPAVLSPKKSIEKPEVKPSSPPVSPSDNHLPVSAVKQMELFDDRLLSKKARIRHKLIGQLFDTYWLVEYDSKFYIIDQHAAHEKVLYERFMKEYKNKAILSQFVSPPEIISLSLSEASMLNQHMEVFQKFGFEIACFGGREYSIRAVPSNLYGISVQDLFLEILDNLESENNRQTPDSISQRIATAACKEAVKGNQMLSPAEADNLIDELLGLENPYHCPHGRPTIISMTKYELEKKFKRIV